MPGGTRGVRRRMPERAAAFAGGANCARARGGAGSVFAVGGGRRGGRIVRGGGQPRCISDSRGGVMSELLLDAAGRRRSPGDAAGVPRRQAGAQQGCATADPPAIEEIVTLMRHAGDGVHGRRLRGLIAVLWRAGLRIREALALAEADLDARRGSLQVIRGKGGRRREVGMDDWAWQQLAPWLQARLKLPVGRTVLRRRRRHGRAALGGRRRAHRAAPRRPRRRREACFAPHQLRHAHAARQVSSPRSTLTVSVARSSTNSKCARKRCPVASLVRMSVSVALSTCPLSTNESTPWPSKPSLVVIVRWAMAITRSPCSCTSTLPTKVTVISSPLQGLMSVKTSRMGSSTGGLAAAGTANARATTLSRPTTSLFMITPRRRTMGSDHRVRPCQALQVAAGRKRGSRQAQVVPRLESARFLKSVSKDPSRWSTRRPASRYTKRRECIDRLGSLRRLW